MRVLSSQKASRKLERNFLKGNFEFKKRIIKDQIQGLLLQLKIRF